MNHDLRTKALALAALENRVELALFYGKYMAHSATLKREFIESTPFAALAAAAQAQGIAPDPALMALEAENERLRAKVEEQENTMAGIRGQTFPQMQTHSVTVRDGHGIRWLGASRCSSCGRTAAELPAGFSLLGSGGTGQTAYHVLYHCSPVCPGPKTTGPNGQ